MSLSHRKLVTRTILSKLLSELRRQKPGEAKAPTVVQCHGCFDIVHPGHIRYLQFARAQGDVLIVSITGDSEVNKGDQRPYIPQELRAENLAALECVDFVVINAEETACGLLAELRPDVYVKGQEYAQSRDARFLAERRCVEAYGGRVIFSSGEVVFSSSRMLETIWDDGSWAQSRLTAMCVRHGIDAGGLGGLLSASRGAKILVLGDVHLERYAICDCDSTLTESPMMNLRVLGERDYAGGGAFLAAQLACWGASPVLLTRLSTDPCSRATREFLDSLGVQVVDLGMRQPMAVVSRFMVDDQKLLRCESGRIEPLDTRQTLRLEDEVRNHARSCRAVLVHDRAGGLIPGDLARRVLLPLRRSGVLLAGGIASPRADAARFGGFDLICASERKLRGGSAGQSSGLSSLAFDLLQRAAAKRLLVTVQKRGLVLFDRQSHDPRSEQWSARLRSDYWPALTDQAIDRVGAGESVLAAATLVLGAGGSLMQAGYLAAAAAAMQVSRPGLQPTTGADFIDWLGGRPELGDSPTGGDAKPQAAVGRLRNAHDSVDFTPRQQLISGVLRA
jgi:rfaE bifunctional protein nucleotidyltransferase chain/domain